MRLVLLVILMVLAPSLQLRQGTGEGVPVAGVSSLTFPGAAAAETRVSRARWPGPFAVEVLRVLDGDTVEVRFVDGPCGRGPCPGQELNLRLLDIDAPEAHRCRSRGQAGSGGRSCAACDAEHRLGQQAMLFTGVMTAQRAARAARLRPDKFGGRVVGDLQVLENGVWVSVGAALVEAGLAIPYDGGRKNKPWCTAERKS